MTLLLGLSLLTALAVPVAASEVHKAEYDAPAAGTYVSGIGTSIGASNLAGFAIGVVELTADRTYNTVQVFASTGTVTATFR